MYYDSYNYFLYDIHFLCPGIQWYRTKMMNPNGKDEEFGSDGDGEFGGIASRNQRRKR